MKALVTGASGFTGYYQVKNLLEHGYKVRAFVRKTSNIDELKKLNVELVYGELTNPDEVEQAVAGVDVVYHIAAVYRAANLPDSAYWDVNVTGTEYLLQSSFKHGIKKFVHCSTCGVHGHVANPPADENAPIHPEDIYQETKYEGEKLALSYYHEKGLPVTVVRPVGIYGPGDTRMLKMYKNVQDGKMVMFGGGNVLYHLTFVEDIVDGFRLAGESEKSAGQVYIIAGDGWTTLMGFSETVAAELGVKPPRFKPPVWPLMMVAYVCEWICVPLHIQPPIFPRRAHIFTHDRAFDISKAKRDLGFAPKVPMKEGIHRTAQWYIDCGFLKPRKSN